MKKIIAASVVLCSALAVSPVMANENDFHALDKLSATPLAMTDAQLESVEGGLISVSVGNVNALNCVVAICKNSGNQYNDSFNYTYKKY
jgi:hypothetical protein